MVDDKSDFSIDSSVITTRFKIVILGDVAVGKTSLISRFVDNKYKGDYEPSIGVDFASKSIKYKDKIIKLQIWDTAGQEKYKSLIPSYIRGSNIIFIVYDTTKKESYDNIPSWIKFIQSQNVPKANVIVLGNKIDLNEKREVENHKIKDIFQTYNHLCFEISAKTGENLTQAFYTAISLLPVFEGYTGSTEDIVKQLEIENLEKQNQFESNNNSYFNGISLDTAKPRQGDLNMSESNHHNKDLSIRISADENQKQFQEFQKGKKCKC